MLCVYVTYHYREHQGRYGTQKHIEVAEAHHTNDGHDDGEDEVMITDWMAAWWCIHCHLWSSWLLLDHHYIGTRLQERRGNVIY